MDAAQPVSARQLLLKTATGDVLANPVFIVGAARSGTTLLGKILRQHRDVCYIEEPRMIWRYGNDGRSDMLRPEHATPKVISYIRKQFGRRVIRSRRSRLVEKSPSNALRMEFIDRVFPDARFVHIIRNGLDSVLSIRSMTEEFGGGVTHPRMIHRTLLRLREMSPRQFPHYAGEFLRRLLPKRLVGAREWGPRIPGLSSMAKELDPLDVACLQWRMCVEEACHAGRAMPAGKYMELRLEELSVARIEDILKFCGLPADAAVSDFIAREFDASIPGARRDAANQAEIAQARKWVDSTMKWLGYEV